MTDPNLDREFSFGINLGGIKAPTGMGNVQVPEGYYRAKVDDMYVNPERNANRAVIKLEIIEAPYFGVIRTDGINLPRNDEDKVRYYWRAFAESAGYTAAQLDAGEITLGRTSFAGKEVFIHYNPKESASNTTGYDRVGYLSEAIWNQKKQVFDGSASTTPAPTPQPSSVASADVKAMLGLA